MPKVKSDENDDATEKERDSEDGGDDENDDSTDELTPVRPKIGESKDTLRKRSDYFRKRHS